MLTTKITNTVENIKDYFSELSFIFLKRSFSSAWQNVLRNKMVSVSTILLITLILLLFHFTQALQVFVNESVLSLNKQVDLIVEITDDKNPLLLTSLKERIETLDGIEYVQIYSKEEALDAFLTAHDNISRFLKKYKLENPLPSTIEVQASSAASLEKVLVLLQESQYSSFINQSQVFNNQNQKDRISKLVQFGSFVNYLAYSFVFILFMIVAFVVFNAINVAIHHRKDEIAIMNVVGASKLFIQLPFIFEAILYSLISLVVMLVVALSLHFQFLLLLENSFEGLIVTNVSGFMDSFLAMYPTLIFNEFLLLMIVSVVTSFVAIELYLKKHST